MNRLERLKKALDEAWSKPVTKSYPLTVTKDETDQLKAEIYFPPNAKNPRAVWEEE